MLQSIIHNHFLFFIFLFLFAKDFSPILILKKLFNWSIKLYFTAHMQYIEQ